MNPADQPPFRGAAPAELERRYQRLLRLYPREFRARREPEMLGVLMASARAGQARPAWGDVADIVRGSLLMRLRGPRGGWAPALAVFALLAPLFLVLTDILLVAVPYWESQGAWESRVRSARAAAAAGAAVEPQLLQRVHEGGTGLLGNPGFLILALGHVIVAAAVLAGLRRTALAALLVVVGAYLAQQGHLIHSRVLQPGLTMMLLTGGVFLVAAFALAVADPWTARRLVTWRPAAAVLLLLAAAVRAWSFAADADASLAGSPAQAYLVTGFVLAAIALALPLVFSLGWRVSLLLAAACYPSTVGATVIHTSWIGAVVPTKWVLGLPPLLVACWGVAAAVRRAASRRGGAPGPAA